MLTRTAKICKECNKLEVISCDIRSATATSNYVCDVCKNKITNKPLLAVCPTCGNKIYSDSLYGSVIHCRLCGYSRDIDI